MPFMLIGTLCMVAFLVLMFLGFNIPFSMLIGGVVGLVIMKGPGPAGNMIASEFINTFSNYSLAVGPMFGLMGYLASYTGVGEKLFLCLKAFTGHRKGGLASSVQVASTGFGAICGSPIACIATMTSVAYPEMRKQGYAPELAAMAISVGGSMATLIPPSSTLIIYGIITETSISQLFMSGIVPGILCCIINIVTIKLILTKRPEWATTSPKASGKERWEAIKHGGIIEILVVFVIAMGGMFAGFFTPTEAGAVGVFGMVLVTIIDRTFTWKKFLNALWSGVRLQAVVYFLLACANVMSKMLAVSRIPLAVGNWVEGLGWSPLAIVLVIFFIYFILGMFTDLNAMILITVPMFLPIITEYCGYSPIWFGVVIDIIMGIGALTPPVGTCVFFQKGFIQQWDPDVTVGSLFKAATPYLINRFVLLAIFVAIPATITLLPHLVYGSPL